MTSSEVLASTVLVTGGNGRIGRLLVEALRRRGQRAVSLARDHSLEPHTDDVIVDLSDAAAVNQAIDGAGAHTLVHLAAVLQGDELETMNGQIDHAVAEAVAEAGVRNIVYASSSAVYGSGLSARSESSPLAGDTPYARSKTTGEQIFGALARTGDVAVTVLRIFNVAGPAMRESLVQRLLRATAEDPVTVFAADEFTRDYVHQDDLIEVFSAAIDTAGRGTRVVNVGAGVPVTTRMLLERLQVDPRSYSETEGSGSASWADISELVRVFGILPRAVPDRSWD